MNRLFGSVNSLTLVKIILTILFLQVLFLNLAIIYELSAEIIIATAVISFVLLVVGYIAMSRYRSEIKKIESIIVHAAKGSLYHRVTSIDSSEDIGQLAWSINDLLDQLEPFSRDIDTS